MKIIKKEKKVENNEFFVYGMLILILMFLLFDFRYLEFILSCWVRVLFCFIFLLLCRFWRGIFYFVGSLMKGFF